MASEQDIQAAIDDRGPAVTLRVKVVPGASRNRVIGMLGDRLKLSVSAAPEAGKANKAVCQLLADVLSLPLRDVTVSAGLTQPAKTLTLTGITAEKIVTSLARSLTR